jgi:ribosomal protein L7Ae-like RNA K-turn-binding protein
MSDAAESFQVEDLTILSALKKVMEICRNHDSVSIGATEVARQLYRITPETETQKPKLIVVSKDLIKEYQDIIMFKARELNIPVLFVDSRKELASIMPFKAKNIGAVGIKDFIHEGREKAFILNAYSN